MSLWNRVNVWRLERINRKFPKRRNSDIANKAEMLERRVLNGRL